MVFQLDSSLPFQQKTISDYMRDNEDRALKKRLTNAQISEMERKSQEIDISKLGEQAFIKASQGMPLTPQETAALNYIDSKQQTVTVNPVTGALETRPSLLDRAGLTTVPNQAPSAIPTTPPTLNTPIPAPQGAPAAEPNEWDAEYEQQLRDAAGNPKLQQSIREKYSNSKLSMTDAESKNAGYADRFALSEPILTDPEKISAYSSFGQQALDFINPFGDQLNSDAYKSYNQARKNATTAKLRQESGAQIAATEFKTDDETLYPQVGDSPELLEQKRQNRETVHKSLKRAAGPAYKPQKPTLKTPIPKPAPAGKWKIEEVPQ